jgi:cellulose 1,4-beta-cellobiosidase
MDVWEANSVSAAYTPHVCTKPGQTMCTGDVQCGAGNDRYKGVCDKDGCDFNSYRMGNHTFYGKGETIDTSKKFTVVTKFITDDGTDTGKLSAIERVYVQDGKVIQNSKSDIKGVDGNKITDGFCKQQKAAFGDKDSFEARGGLSTMGDAFERGMVLVLSTWVDYAAEMRWLDAPYPAGASKSKPGVVRGTCGADSGVPATVIADSPSSSVTWSNIKFGALGSTY